MKNRIADVAFWPWLRLAGTLFWGLRVSLGFCSRTFTQCSDRQLFFFFQNEEGLLFYEVCTKTPRIQPSQIKFKPLLWVYWNLIRIQQLRLRFYFRIYLSLPSSCPSWTTFSSDRTDMIPFCLNFQRISSCFAPPSVFIGFNFIIFPLMCLSTWSWVGLQPLPELFCVRSSIEAEYIQ